MNRQERRKQDRELNQNVKTINNLNAAQIRLMEAILKERVEAERDKLHNNIFVYLGYTLLKNFVDEITSIKILEEIREQIKEDNIEKYEKEFYEMESMREQIMDFFKEKGITNRKEAIAAAVFKFPSVAKRSIMKYFDEWKKLQVAEGVEEEEEMDPDTQEGVEKIMDIINEKHEKEEAKKILNESDKVAADAEKGDATEKVVCSGNSCRIITTEGEQAPPKKTDEDRQAPNGEKQETKHENFLQVKAMQIVMTSLDNTYTLTKEKIEMVVDGDTYEIKSEEDFLTYQKNVMDYCNRLLGESKQAYTKWLFECKRAV